MERRESVRLLYVAMTRAKEQLILLGGEKAESGSLAEHLDAAEAWPQAGLQRGLPALFIEAGRVPEPEAAPAVRSASGADAVATARAWARRGKRRAGTEQPRARAATAYLRTAPKLVPASSDEANGSVVGAEAYRLCHRVLQAWDFAARGNPAVACAVARSSLARRAPGPHWEQAEREASAVLSVFPLLACGA